MWFDLHLFLQTTVIGLNRSCDLFKPIIESVCKIKWRSNYKTKGFIQQNKIFICNHIFSLPTGRMFFVVACAFVCSVSFSQTATFFFYVFQVNLWIKFSYTVLRYMVIDSNYFLFYIYQLHLWIKFSYAVLRYMIINSNQCYEKLL